MRTVIEVTIWDEESNSAGTFAVGSTSRTTDVRALAGRLESALAQYGYKPCDLEGTLTELHAARAEQLANPPKREEREGTGPERAQFREGLAPVIASSATDEESGPAGVVQDDEGA